MEISPLPLQNHSFLVTDNNQLINRMGEFKLGEDFAIDAHVSAGVILHTQEVVLIYEL